jgi:hypothetical protein
MLRLLAISDTFDLEMAGYSGGLAHGAKGILSLSSPTSAQEMVSVAAWMWVIIAVVVVLAVVAVIWSFMSRRRTARLRGRFGPEYERSMAESGGRRKAEAELVAREKRRDELDIRPLPAAARERYAVEWRRVQARFVDEPAPAVANADRLVMAVMGDRGYPTEDFEQRSADVSVDHPHVVDNYRAAHAVSMASERGEAATEDLRQAMVHYRSLFDGLLGEGDDGETIREVG